MFEKSVKITQIKSPIGRKDDQLATLIGLGLNKMNRSRIIVLNDSINGMLKKVRHLVSVEEV